jgi:hypothetical protein
MIISHTHKFIFLKSFKTAGTSIDSTLSNFCSGDDIVTPINDYRHNRNERGEFLHKAMNAEEFIKLNLPNLQHPEARIIKDMVASEVWNNYFKFSIARNPWDRAISYFYWDMRNDPRLKPKKRFYHHLGVPYDELGQLRKLFSEFIKNTHLPSNDPFYILNGELCVDFLIRYENLSKDFDEVLARLRLPHVDLPRLKRGIRAGGYHYSEYYDEETMEIVAEQHKNDIRLLGYKFEAV